VRRATTERAKCPARRPASSPRARDCRAGQKEIADLALYLASDASSFLTGQTIYIDGGESLKKYPELFRFLSGAQ
jgi:NAD(P)-dependent dehydrogenase (short-subunit alcohol dehydrogenase family)